MKQEQIAKAQKILLYGYGQEGQSSHQYLSKKFPDKKITIFDENPFHQTETIKIPDFCLHQKNKCHYDLIIVSPGVSRKKLLNAPPEIITSNTEIFFDNLPDTLRKKVIGISGTKGKSTTTKCCTEVLQESGLKAIACGNYGLPLLDLLDDFINGKYDYLVAELSSFQLENLQKSPGIAIFLNLFNDHLDRHKTPYNYQQAKINLWKHQTKDDLFITPAKTDLINKTPKYNTQPILSFPVPKEIFPEGSIFRAPYFLENTGTIQTLIEHLHLPKTALRKVAQQFKGLPHRLEYFATKQNIKFYDDALSTNPDATKASVEFFGPTLGSIILGGQDRKTSFDKLIETLNKLTNAHIIILESETKTKLLHSCHKINYQKIHITKNLKEATQKAFEITPPNTICLLSTAAPSFGLFKNYKEKGQQFKAHVEKREQRTTSSEQ